VTTSHRGDEQQAPTRVALVQMTAERLRHEPRAAHVRVHHGLPLVVGHVLDRRGSVVAGGDEDGVDLPERLDRGADHRSGVPLAVGARDQLLDVAPHAPRFGGHPGERVRRTRDQQHLRADGGKGNADRATQGSRGAGDHDDLARDVEQRQRIRHRLAQALA
jgi:hypothetical protein